MIRRFTMVSFALMLLAGCNGFQSALGGDAAESANFIDLFIVFMVVCTVMYALVVAGLLLALWRRRDSREPLTVETGNHEQSAPVLKTALALWVGLMAVGLIGLTVASFFVDRSNAAAASKPTVLIKVTANQWWWDVEYQANDASKIFRTANEIHLPVGVPIRIELRSRDVIHSLWIPNLAGKQDLVPGRVSDLHILARRTGLYRGQCAEFCGTQHTNMALDVTVESRADFQRWAAAQRRPAFAPRTPVEIAGYRYFNSRECSVCHNVSGSPASARIGPDLTHFASRRSIAAGTLPMNKGNLYGWIADPQSQKAGSHMPTVGLSADELHALVAYLETLR